MPEHRFVQAELKSWISCDFLPCLGGGATREIPSTMSPPTVLELEQEADVVKS